METEKRVVLRPMNLRWMSGDSDDLSDLCAHGDVDFRVGDETLLGETNGKNLTVSASALYLLRTLSTPHTKTQPVGDHLFPCCGMGMFDVSEQEDVVVLGCPNGEDFFVLHQDGRVVIENTNGRQWIIGWSDWKAAVFYFADRVQEFYASCSRKKPTADDEAGFRKFWSEWRRRRSQFHS